MVAEIVEQKKQEIASLCQVYGVHSLWLLGSETAHLVASGTGSATFIVDLGDYDDTAVTRYLGLAEELETLLEQTVVLVSSGILKYRHVLRGDIEGGRIIIHG